MKCHYRTANGRLVFEIEGGNQKVIFEGIAQLQEVFEADVACGCCNSQNIRFRVRDAKNSAGKSFKYYEMSCNQCYARLDFGQSQDMATLFVKRKDEQGHYMANRGWYKYQGQQENGQTQ